MTEPTGTRVRYDIQHPPGVVARVLVNDVPFYQDLVDYYASPSGRFNHLLLQGENTITFAIDEVSPDPYVIRRFTLKLVNHETEQVLFTENYPGLFEQYPKEERKLPFVHHAKFLFDEETPKPVWLDAPKESFGPEGTPDQHKAVFELWDAYNRQDIDDFLKAMELKTAEFQKFYGLMPELSADAARAEYGAALKEPWDLEPFDPKQLLFERRCDGRVVHVLRNDGGFALRARHKTDPVRSWNARLLMTRVEGRWRIFW